MKTIFYNAVVYSGTLPLTEAFVVENSFFTFCGTSEQALQLWHPGDVRVNLQGRFVCPGFNDSHMHLLNYGQTLRMAPLAEHTGSLEDMLHCLRECLLHGCARRGGWLMGRGWNQDYFSDIDRMPNRWDLDRVSETVPICAVRACGHALVLNSRALAAVGITTATPQPDGGQIVHENGVPNGVLFDTAMDMVYEIIPSPSQAELKQMIRAACRTLNAYGVTSSQSDDYCVFRGLPWAKINEAYQELEAAGELTVRVTEQVNFKDLPSLKSFISAGNHTGVGTEWFKIGPLKMLGDGALGARTAFLSRPYADDPSTRGIPVFSQETFDEMIGYANSHEMQIAVHAIGDACLDRVISSVEKALFQHAREDHRHGIVHCQISRPEQLERLAAMKMHIYAQSIFLNYDIQIVAQRVGEKLASSSYSWKRLRELGATVSNGTDCPVEPPFALGGIQCAVTRRTLQGQGPYLQQEAFTVQEALDSYTKAGAYASFEEAYKGQIYPGMLADFIVLDANPFEVDADTIKNIKVLATYVGGRTVFNV